MDTNSPKGDGRKSKSMKEIALTLITYGIDFSYLNFCSEGDTIQCNSFPLSISGSNGEWIIQHYHNEHKFRGAADIPNVLKFVTTAIMEETT